MPNDPAPPERRPTRRGLLGAGLLAVAGVAAGGRWTIRRIQAGPLGWDEPLPFLTDASVFYDRFQDKRFDPIFWWTSATKSDEYPVGHEPSGPLTLAFDGALDRPREFSEAGLRKRFEEGPRVSLLKTMQCAGDAPSKRLASNGVWTGLPLRVLLDDAGLRPGTARLRVHADDGFTANLRPADLRRPDGRLALLAFELNGKPLPVPRGGPFRLLIPNKFGFKNVKWPVRIEATDDDAVWGNHEAVILQGTDHGERTIGAKILRPNLHAHRPVVETAMEPRLLAGVAFGGPARVRAVRVRVDDGPWRTARLPRPEELKEHPVVREAHARAGGGWPLEDVWTPWVLPWRPEAPGDYEVIVQVENERGEVSPETDPDRMDGDSSWARGIIRVT